MSPPPGDAAAPCRHNTNWRQAERDAVRARPTAKRWDDAAVEAAVDEAEAMAHACLADLLRRHGERRPEDYLGDLGLKVQAVGFSDQWARPYFSLYDQASGTIEVNIRLIRDLDRHLKATGRDDWTTDERLRQVSIAHELLHHIVPRPPVPSLRQRWQQRDQSARADIVEEIAAVRFSQLLLGLDYSPLDYTEAARELATTSTNEGSHGKDH